MQVKIFSIPFDPEKQLFNQRSLDDFMKDKKLVDKNDYIFEQGGRVFLALVVRYEPMISADGPPVSTKRVPIVGTANADASENTVMKKKSYDPKNLEQRQRKLYDKMRHWRYERATEQSIPAYMICTNRQLEMIVRNLPASIEQLSAIEGMREGKLKSHGEPLVRALSGFQKTGPIKNNTSTQKIA